MKKNLLRLAICILFLSACSLTAPQPSAAPTPTDLEPTTAPALALSPSVKQTYPLEAGAYWVYQGLVAYQQGEEVVEEPILWRVEVLEKVERQYVTGYRMRGELYDLAFYTPETQPREYAILQAGRRFYRVELDAYERLKDESDLLIGLVNEYQLVLELPLEAGGRFCDTEQITREYADYCWVVGERKAFSLNDQTVQAYPISYSTNPDYTEYAFTPGIGYVAFIYYHGGTASIADVKLVEYVLGGES